MKEPYTARLVLFAQNAQSIKKEFPWQNALVSRLAALLYTTEDKVADEGAIRASYELIKENTGLFSSFRGLLQSAFPPCSPFLPTGKDSLETRCPYMTC